MKQGLDLCRQYYYEIAHEAIISRFSHLKEHLAVGMVGPGSDCFGFDDEISRDHDWGPGFCLFVPDDIYITVADELSEWYNTLPKTFEGYGPRVVTESGRIGVIHIENFFTKHTGLRSKKPTLLNWLYANTEGLALVGNGEIYYDNAGELTSWRSAFGQYPEDVRCKKIASACFLAGQSGQYNLERSKRRGDAFAYDYALTQFCSSALSLAFLLAGRFAPYYKWKLHASRLLPEPYSRISDAVEDILMHRNDDIQDKVESLSSMIVDLIKAQKLADIQSDFLADYHAAVNQTIVDEEIRNLPTLF